ncbi:methionine synthase [Oceanicoccus sagamiensis]
MSDQEKYNDGLNDAFAATAVIALVVGTVVFWLSGMPV